MSVYEWINDPESCIGHCESLAVCLIMSFYKEKHCKEEKEEGIFDVMFW
jgi:hypothetical protein